MFERTLKPILLHAASSFRVLLLTGPRQSGKTTLLRTLFPDFQYLSLESPDRLEQIKSDPRGVLNQATLWLIDEAQTYPELFSYIQEYVDDPNKNYRFILSGSQNFLLAEKVSQSLAGRVAILELLPLSYSEFATHPHLEPLPLWHYLFKGSYPRPYQEKIDTYLWYESYLRTYLERDVRQLINVKDLSKFQLFLRLCAGRHGQLINLNSMSNDCGVSQTTLTQWLSILEQSYVLFRLQPYFKNFNKRLVKTPKLYFYDTALVCHLLNIDSAEHLSLHSARGAIFEGFVITETIKHFLNQGKRAPVFFWRDHAGLELDLLIELGNSLTAIEIKSSETYTSELLKGLKKWIQIASNAHIKSALIYAGADSMTTEKINIVPWQKTDDYLLKGK
ncbi:MAG: ATP-binding protein [Pseudomonadota bacterium]